MRRLSFRLSFVFASLLFFLFCASALPARSQELHLPLPKKSKYTPVQQLNRDGVQALKKHNIDKAKRLFYKAYLIDPNDPFTLNNLGYVAELEGEVDRAHRYYDQAQAGTSEAVVDRSTEDTAQGKKVSEIAGRTQEGPLKINEMNGEAISMLAKDRAPEADVILQQALRMDPKNPFTLNNLAFAREKEGELEQALRYYNDAARSGSQDKVVVALNKDWRGRPISEVAARNADKVRREMEKSEDVDARVSRLNLRGVSAMNRNERKAAREDFQQAYKLDPSNSFTINNMGYLAELEGDRETAQMYYEEAKKARHASLKVAMATRPEVEGRPVGEVAEQSDALVESRVTADAAAKRRTSGTPALRTRDNKTVVDKPNNQP
ncbi:MAG TPA: tetratricopeptide repeat protein [Candidatus Angelobacter sp.]|nr:tetratricopeptide repeat protein [Candidatus Angelobacter sp.]